MLNQVGVLNTNGKNHFLSGQLDVSHIFSEFKDMCLHTNLLFLLQKEGCSIQLN